MNSNKLNKNHNKKKLINKDLVKKASLKLKMGMKLKENILNAESEVKKKNMPELFNNSKINMKKNFKNKQSLLGINYKIYNKIMQIFNKCSEIKHPTINTKSICSRKEEII